MSALDMAIQMADMSYGLDDRLRPDDLIMSASKELADLRTRIAELEALTQWQPIESAPKYTWIYVKRELSETDYVVEKVYNIIGFWNEPVVGWMPLPKPPEETE